MLHTRLIAGFAAAGLLAVAGCSDSTAPNVPRLPTPSIPQIPEYLTISGSVHAFTTSPTDLVLMTIDGVEIPLAGEPTSSLARVNEAGVDVRGFWNTDGTFEVADFIVREVGGKPVLDGVLIALLDTEIYTETSNILGYALRLTRGETVLLNAPPTDLVALVGSRVWVAGPADEPPTAFGFISE